MTPLAGKDSGPSANLAWGLVNVVVAAGLACRAVRMETRPGRAVLPFAAGAAAFTLWGVVYESLHGASPPAEMGADTHDGES